MGDVKHMCNKRCGAPFEVKDLRDGRRLEEGYRSVATF